MNGCPHCGARAIKEGDEGARARWYDVHHTPECYYSLTHAANQNPEQILDTLMSAWLVRAEEEDAKHHSL